MAEPFIGEIRMFAGNFAPAGWAICAGQILPIAEYEALFVLIGTTYGGDGQTIFALPDLRGRVPVHQGAGFTLAKMGGAETVTLTTNQIPAHNHAALAHAGPASAVNPTSKVWAGGSQARYSDQSPDVSMNSGALALDGGSQPHDNMPPFLAVNFIISLFGVFPS